MIHHEFRSGNIAPEDHNLIFIQRCEAQLPKEKQIEFVRADSASYQAELFDYCEDNHITYTVGTHLDSSALRNINEIQKWETMRSDDGKTHHVKEEVVDYSYYARY